MAADAESRGISIIRLTDGDALSGELLTAQSVTPPRDLILDLSAITYLASLHPGDVITINDTIENTDLAPETVHIILSALTKANLFERNGDRFTRRPDISC